MNTIQKFLLFPALLLLWSDAFAGVDVESKAPMKTKKEVPPGYELKVRKKTVIHEEPYKTLILIRNRKNVPADIEKRFSKILRRRMLALPNTDYSIPGRGGDTVEKLFGKDCGSTGCIIREAKEKKIHRIIIYDLKYIKNDKYQALDKKGPGQYLLAPVTYDRLFYALFLIDVESGKVIYTSEETLKVGEYKKSIRNVYSRLEPLFPPRQISGTIEEEYLVKLPEPEKRIVETKKIPMFWTAVMRILTPFGDYAETSKMGFGIQGSFGVMDLFSKNLEFSVRGGLYSIQDKRDRIDAYYTGNLVLNCGYRFDLAERIMFIPGAGLGYYFHYVIDENKDSNDFLYDPMVDLNCSLAYKIKDNDYLFFDVGTGIFFEKDSTGMFFSFGLGIRKHF